MIYLTFDKYFLYCCRTKTFEKFSCGNFLSCVLDKIFTVSLFQETSTALKNFLLSPCSLSNSRWHSANADVIADVKSKIIVSRWHFFADVIFFATSKVQSYQNLYTQTNTCSLHISRNFKDIFIVFILKTIYMLRSLSLENCKQLRKWNRLYRSSLSAMFFSIDIRSNQFRVDLYL